MSHTIAIFLGMISLLLASVSLVSASDAAIVNTTNGPVRGKVIPLKTNKTVIQYLGVPFARAKRFEAPESPKRWETIKNATSYGASCPQLPSIVLNSTEIEEDCLSVNVFLPGNNEARGQGSLWRVMVWIYGGAFQVGTSAYKMFFGGYLATEGEVVVVTFNYRIGVLGFLSTGTEDLPGNFGLLDQVKALEWVQENIEKFGGDPNNVTIFGQSAGACSVALHMMSPMSAGLYHKVILQSGTAASMFASMDNKTAIESATAIANLLGCSMDGLKSCLKKKSISEILKAQKNLTSSITSGRPFLPVVDHKFLYDLPFNLLVNGQFNQTVPAMIGVTQNEGGFFVLHMKGLSPGVPGIDKGLNKTYFDKLVKDGHWVRNQTQKVLDAVIFQYTDWTNQTNQLVVRQKYMDVITDAIFKAPAARSAQVFVKNTIKTFFYCFDHFDSARAGFPEWAGVFHGSDLPYVFGAFFKGYNTSLFPNEQNKEILFSKQVITLWSNFAKNGKPTAENISWPEYTLGDKQYVSLKPSSSVQRNMLPEKMAFWNTFVPSLAELVPTMIPVNPPTTAATLAPTGPKEASTDKGTEDALIAVVTVLGFLLIVFSVVIWRLRRKLVNTSSEPNLTTKLI